MLHHAVEGLLQQRAHLFSGRLTDSRPQRLLIGLDSCS